MQHLVTAYSEALKASNFAADKHALATFGTLNEEAMEHWARIHTDTLTHARAHGKIASYQVFFTEKLRVEYTGITTSDEQGPPELLTRDAAVVERHRALAQAAVNEDEYGSVSEVSDAVTLVDESDSSGHEDRTDDTEEVRTCKITFGRLRK